MQPDICIKTFCFQIFNRVKKSYKPFLLHDTNVGTSLAAMGAMFLLCFPFLFALLGLEPTIDIMCSSHSQQYIKHFAFKFLTELKKVIKPFLLHDANVGTSLAAMGAIFLLFSPSYLLR